MSNSNANTGADDLFVPLRTATPEVSLARLQRAVAMAPNSVALRPWGSLAGGVVVVALSIAGALLFRAGEEAAPTGLREMLRGNDGSSMTIINDEPKQVATVRHEPRIRAVASTPISNKMEVASAPISNPIPAPVPASMVPPAIPAAAMPALAMRNSVRSSVEEIRSRREKGAENAGDIYRFTAGLQAGVIYGSLNTLGGGFTASVEHDWQHIGFRYTSTFGQKTNSDQLFGRVADATKQYTQRVIEYGLLFGLTVRQGDFYATFAGGPNYTKSAIFATDPSTPTTMIGNQWQGIGFTTQASFGTQLSNGLGLDLTGFVSFHSQIMYGGTMLSLQYTIVN